MTTFIETYSDVLQRKTCRTLVEWFENIKTSMKNKSWDIRNRQMH